MNYFTLFCSISCQSEINSSTCISPGSTYTQTRLTFESSNLAWNRKQLPTTCGCVTNRVYSHFPFHLTNEHLFSQCASGYLEWRIQDFPKVCPPTLEGMCQSIIGQKNDKNCMKMKEIGPKGGWTHVPSAPPRSANDLARIGNRFSFSFLR